MSRRRRGRGWRVGRTRGLWWFTWRRWRDGRLRRGHCVVADALHGVGCVARLNYVREPHHLEDGPVRLRVLEFGAKPEASWAEGGWADSKRRSREGSHVDLVALFPEYFPHRGCLCLAASSRLGRGRSMRRPGREGRRRRWRGRRRGRRRRVWRRERGGKHRIWRRRGRKRGRHSEMRADALERRDGVAVDRDHEEDDVLPGVVEYAVPGYLPSRRVLETVGRKIRLLVEFAPLDGDDALGPRVVVRAARQWKQRRRRGRRRNRRGWEGRRTRAWRAGRRTWRRSWRQRSTRRWRAPAVVLGRGSVTRAFAF